MSDNSPPPDPMMMMMMQQQDAAAKKAAQDKIDAEQHKADLAALRTSSSAQGRNSARQYFSDLGLNPDEYGSQIDSKIQDILNGIAPTDENPGSYFKNAGQSIYGDLSTSNQAKLQAQLDQIFSPNFEASKVPMTIDDPYISDIYNEQRGNADAIIQNMLKRGVLTDAGAGGAEADLDRQSSGVRGKLRSFGDAVVAGGQGQLRDEANKARQAAGTIKLGQQFDPTQYSKDTDQIFNDFVSSIGDQIRAKVPGNLFQTSGLAAIGGAAQGAGNTKYNPNAAAGVIDPNDPNNQQQQQPSNRESIF